jgi:GNAT superfamily N-acetyltransferase
VPFPRRLVESNVAAGDLYLADLAGETVGTVTLVWDDPVIWGDDGRDGRAGYVHRLVVTRTHAGTGLGAGLLAWAGEQSRARGRAQLRLDVVSHNTPLRRYYERAGFAHLRDASGAWVDRHGTRHEWVTSLYERPVE